MRGDWRGWWTPLLAVVADADASLCLNHAEHRMIAYLEGRVLTRRERSFILVTEGGVGYELAAAAPFLVSLPAAGEFLAVYVQTIVREDAMELYGFESLETRNLFALLISISKLGPKTALAILSTFDTAELTRIVAEEDVTTLTRVPGIGKKSAQHIALELRYKLKDVAPAAVASQPGGRDAAPPAASAALDALAGLTNLGYDEREARAAVDAVLAEEPDLAGDKDVAGILRAALKHLAKGRAS